MPELPSIDPHDDWIENHPLGMLALGPDEQVLWVNRTLLELLDIGREELVSPQAGGLEALLGEQDPPPLMRHGRPLRLRRHARTMRSTDGQPIRVLFFEDLSEITILQAEIASLRDALAAQCLEDPLTGLPNQRGFRQLLDHQVTRSRRYDNPLSLMAVRLRVENRHAEIVPPLSDGALLAAAQSLRDRMRWADCIGRWDDATFLIALPETSLRDVDALIGKIEQGLVASQELINQRFPVEVDIGQAEWKPRMDARILLDNVLRALDDSRQTMSLTG